MQAIGDIFIEIQESQSIPNKAIFSLIEQYQKKQTTFINALEQCYLKIMKSMISLKSVLKRQYEIYEKLTEKFFSTLHANYIKKPIAEKGHHNIAKEEILSNFYRNFILEIIIF